MSNKQPAYTRAAPRPASEPKQPAVTRYTVCDAIEWIDDMVERMEYDRAPTSLIREGAARFGVDLRAVMDYYT